MARWVIDARPFALPRMARDPELLARAARLHDIGVVCAHDGLAHSGKRLRLDEVQRIRPHCDAGFEALAPLLDQSPEDALLQIASDIALGHHERYDGSGFPHGLSGDEIGVHVQLVSLADVLDELTCGRNAGRRVTFEAAARIIVEGVGADFGPVAVAAFSATQHRLETLHGHLATASREAAAERTG